MANLRSRSGDCAVRIASIIGITPPPFRLGTMLFRGANAAVDFPTLAIDPRARARVKSRALLLAEREHVAAARSIGASSPRMLLRHGVPNPAPIVFVQARLALSTAILAEASLAFLGVGPQPPAPSPGFDLPADGLQDKLDPRLRSP